VEALGRDRPCRQGFSSYSLAWMAGLESLCPLRDRAGFARGVERRLRHQGIVGPVEFDSGAFALWSRDCAARRPAASCSSTRRPPAATRFMSYT
jgi:hypothetical protein